MRISEADVRYSRARAGGTVPGVGLPQEDAPDAGGARPPTATPIKHLVVIFQENISFDHYFGTYPNATNPARRAEPSRLPRTPAVNGLSGRAADQQSQR